jgi:hypothetical protein
MKTSHTVFASLFVVAALSSFASSARADESETAPVAAAPEHWERRSTALVVAGVTSIAVGAPTTLVGGLATALCVGPFGGNLDPRASATQLHCYPTVGITAAGLGLVAAGVVSILYGSTRVPESESEPSTSYVPSVALGPRSGALTWHF